MPTWRPAETIEDLFSVAAGQEPPAPRAIQQGKALTDNQASLPRSLLPKDLAAALKHLTDTEIDTLLAAVTSEAERRGRVPTVSASKIPTREDARPSLTKGKLNAVRAAFEAGIKPSAIARQFGISQCEVRKALATAGRARTSPR